MKLPHRLALVALLGVPLALFFVARQVSDKRPIKLGVHRGCDSLTFSPAGKTLISRAAYPTFGSIFWNIQSGQRIHLLRADSHEPSSFSPDGKHLAWLEMRTHDAEMSPIVVITSASGQKEKWFPDLKSRPADSNDENVGIEWTSNGREIVVLTRHQVRHFDAQNGHVLSCFAYKKPWPPDDGSAFLSPDGKVMASIETPYTRLRVILRNTQTNKKLGVTIPDDPNVALIFSPASQFVAVEAGPNVHFQRVDNSKILWTWKALGSSQAQFKFSPDEKSVVACNSSHCTAHDTHTGHELWRVKNPNSPIFALSPDGKTLAEARSNGQIFLWPLPQAE
ncbi:hypothetical protein IAD21_04690 [Abditibacteriota bacterium]|nr:hypothetical protein IAD21_04690 [Abditibacteriota bacterium]